LSSAEAFDLLVQTDPELIAYSLATDRNAGASFVEPPMNVSPTKSCRLIVLRFASRWFAGSMTIRGSLMSNLNSDVGARRLLSQDA
jgi:hypothetical protein